MSDVKRIYAQSADFEVSVNATAEEIESTERAMLAELFRFMARQIETRLNWTPSEKNVITLETESEKWNLRFALSVERMDDPDAGKSTTP